MPHHLKKLTPNLIVSDVDRSIAFYRDVLGFSVAQTVPDAAPYVFAIVTSSDVQIHLNAPGPAVEVVSGAQGPAGGWDADAVHRGRRHS